MTDVQQTWEQKLDIYRAILADRDMVAVELQITPVEAQWLMVVSVTNNMNTMLWRLLSDQLTQHAQVDEMRRRMDGDGGDAWKDGDG